MLIWSLYFLFCSQIDQSECTPAAKNCLGIHPAVHRILAGSLVSVFGFNCWVEKERGYTCETGAEERKFYYDHRLGVCQPFMYRGCGGNGNNFDTAADCKQKCRIKKAETSNVTTVEKDISITVNACSLLTDAKVSTKAAPCDSGCPQGFMCNESNKCCPTPYYICRLPVESGREREVAKHYGRYAFVPGLHNCIRFSYFGMEGNFNNFKTYEECKEFCKDVRE